MAGKSILTDEQGARAYKLYFKEHRKPAEMASILMAENEGLKLSARQMSEYAATREWQSKKKALTIRGEAKASQLVAQMGAQMAAQKLNALEKHKDFIDASIRIGGKVVQKAEAIIDTTNNAKDLSTAVNAAAKGIEIYRRAVGIDDPGSSSNGNGSTNVFFNFARGADSPFTRAALARDAIPVEQVVSYSADTPAPNSATGVYNSSISTVVETEVDLPV